MGSVIWFNPYNFGVMTPSTPVLSNPSFETIGSGWNGQSANWISDFGGSVNWFTGWTASSTQGVGPVGQTALTGWSIGNIPSGTVALLLEPSLTISITNTITGLTNGSTYTLYFYLGSYTYAVGNGTTLQVIINGNITPYTITSSTLPFTQQSISFTATSTSASLVLKVLATTGDIRVILDNFTFA